MAAQNPLKTLTWSSGVIARTCSRVHPLRLRRKGTQPIGPSSLTKVCRGPRVSWQHATPIRILIHKKWSSILDTWKSVHTRQTDQGEVWVNEHAERQHHEMLQKKETQTQQASLLGTQFDEYNVVREVLGDRRGHIVEFVGRSPMSPMRCHRQRLHPLLESQHVRRSSSREWRPNPLIWPGQSLSLLELMQCWHRYWKRYGGQS